MARKSRKTVKIVAIEKLVWNCASYSRLSDDDHTEYESNSIENQKELIKKHIEQSEDLLFIESYADDGISGTTFHRPGFENMMEDIKNGKVNCVIVKDLSRLGRNYIGVEDYITKIFPFLKVRFISINDNFDTLNPECDEKMMEIRIKNLANDFYAKQVSLNVGTAFKNMGEHGVYHGPVPPYGFLIDNSDKEKRHLIIEDSYAEISQMIYLRFHSGESIYSITKYLNGQKIVPPMRHFTDLGLYRSKAHEKEILWHRSTVKRILTNPAYCGCLVVSKSKRSLYQNIPWHKIPEEDWELIENTHEAIITREIYEDVQQMLKKKKEKHSEYIQVAQNSRKENIFSGKMKCGHCDENLQRDYFWLADRKGRTYFQHCKGYSFKEVKTKCKECYMNENHLEQICLRLISQYINLLADKWHVLNLIVNSEGYKEIVAKMKQELKKLEKEYQSKDSRKKTLYIDFKSGLITEEEYFFMKSSYTRENKIVQNNIAKMKQRIFIYEDKLNNTKKWMNIFEKHKNITALTKDLMDELILTIYVYSQKRIKIIFKFQDDFESLNSFLQVANNE